MKPFGVDGNTTSHGGSVKATQGLASTHGKRWLVEGDGFNCPKCNNTWSTLIRNDCSISVAGKKVALVGDRSTCGAILVEAQSSTLAGGAAAGGAVSSALESILSIADNLLSSELQSDAVKKLNGDKEIYENYYIEFEKTTHVKLTAVLPPYDSTAAGKYTGWVGTVGQILSGTCNFIVDSLVRGNQLHITAHYIPPAASHMAKVQPLANARVFREEARQLKLIAYAPLIIGKGYWPIDKWRKPIGACSITLPPSNLSLLKVEVDLGYVLETDGGDLYPKPPHETFTFTISSAARRVK